MSNKGEVTLRNKRKGFVMVFNDIANTFKNGDAILLWIYLAAKTDNWLIIKSHLCEHFGWNTKKLNNLFSVLAAYGLVKQYQLKGEGGKFGKYIIEINDGEDYVDISKMSPIKSAKNDKKISANLKKKTSKIKAPHRNPKNRIAAKPHSGKTPTTTDLILQHTESVQHKRATRSLALTTYDKDFFPDTKAREMLTVHAQRTNNTENDLLEKFEKVMIKYKTRSADWQQTFIKFLDEELPKRTYEDDKGQKRRYDNQPLNY